MSANYIAETCRCGACFEYRGPVATVAVAAFRREHAACRANAPVVACSCPEAGQDPMCAYHGSGAGGSTP